MEKRQLAYGDLSAQRIKLVKNCDNEGNGCTESYAELDQKIVPSSEGFYEYGYHACAE